VESVWNSQGHKHINGNAHRSYQVQLFFVYGTAALHGIAGDYGKQHSSMRNYVPGVNSVLEFSILH